MSTNVATQRLIDDGESERVEFVETAESLERIAQTVCAFLNTSGGTIVVGLDDSGSASGSLEMQQAETIRDYLRSVVTPPVVFSVSLDEIEQGSVVVVEVPAGRDVPYVVHGSVYVRQGGSTRPADAGLIRQMVLDKSIDSPRWERRPSLGLELDGLATELLEDTIRLATDRRGYRFRDSGSTAVLEELGLLQFGRLTNAADVAFGKRSSCGILRPGCAPCATESDRGDNFLDEQLYEGPAFRLLDDVLAFLKRHIAIAAEFVPGQSRADHAADLPVPSVGRRDRQRLGSPRLCLVFRQRLGQHLSGSPGNLELGPSTQRADRQNAGNGTACIHPDQPGHLPDLLSPRTHGTGRSRHVQDGP
jgi:ATP-dependent DNA helicase RecG